MMQITYGQFYLMLAFAAFWFYFIGVWRGETRERQEQTEKEARKTRARFEGIDTYPPDVTHGETPGYWQGVKE